MEKEEKIIIKGGRTHNLKNINLELPKNKLIVFTGVSGSGKSSLAFDTIFAEGQRRYIESLSPYVRQFLGQLDRPDVDSIEGLSPAIAINQKALSANPRSIVATLTEIYDYLRVLFSRIGQPYCPKCGQEIKKLSREEIFNLVKEKAKKEKIKSLSVLAPVVRGRKGEYYQLLYDFLHKGFSRAKIDNKIYSLHKRIILPRYKAHTIEIIIDELNPTDETRLFEAIELALNYSDGLVNIDFSSEKTLPAGRQAAPVSRQALFSVKWSCPDDGFSFGEIEPRLFSFNSPYGACQACHGLGKKDLYSDEICPLCSGQRLKAASLSIKIKNKNIWQITCLTIEKAYDFFLALEQSLTEKEKTIGLNIIKEIIYRLKFLLEVGLDYISLDREAATLSGGEAQRIRLASQISTKLSGALYVLDEPTIGLHERDTDKLIKTLKNLKDLNNTVIVVEHDEKVIRQSDFLIDLGPGAGATGGKIIASGQTEKLIQDKKYQSLTLDYLRGEKKIKIPVWRKKRTESLKIVGAKLNNLKNINLEIPLRKLIAVTGVSGSGKSSLLEVLHKNVVNLLYRFNQPLENVSEITGLEYIKRVVEINQAPIGRTPRSNPATYTGVFTPIRDFYACLEQARIRGYNKSRFSFNLKAGRCEACQGAGYNLIEMHFLPPVLVKCEVCQGKRFNRETLAVRYKKKNIADVLDLTIEEALVFFKDIYPIVEKLKILQNIGLGYIKLGQSATTLSGGEAQRIKLAKELSSTSTRTLYLLDEPTTGLHYYDIELLLKILQKLVERQNSVIVIEHNLHLIKTCDWVIDLGPEAGEKGGRVIALGTPYQIAQNKNSYTGQFLKRVL